MKLVTILTITYNHGLYLRQTLESLLQQKTNFEFDILISDDCSTDGTRQICSEFKDMYPEKVRLILREKNIGMMPNFIDAVYNTESKYIAMCEGDDYWCDNNKLQTQVDYLESHSNIVLSAHKSKALFEGQLWNYHEIKQYRQRPFHSEYTIEDYIVKDFFHTSSIVFRRKLIDKFPDWYYNVFGGDYFLVLLLATKGNIHFINSYMSVYRQNQDSVSHYHSRIEIFQNYLKHFQIFKEYTNGIYDKVINRKIITFEYYLNYYNSSYLRKLTFYIKNFIKIWQIDSRAVNTMGKLKILIPSTFLRDKVDINKKKIKNDS